MFLIFCDFSFKLFLNCSYFLIFPNIGFITVWNNKMALCNTCLLLFHPAVCEKTWNRWYVNTASANVTSLLITISHVSSRSIGATSYPHTPPAPSHTLVLDSTLTRLIQETIALANLVSTVFIPILSLELPLKSLLEKGNIGNHSLWKPNYATRLLLCTCHWSASPRMVGGGGGGPRAYLGQCEDFVGTNWDKYFPV